MKSDTTAPMVFWQIVHEQNAKRRCKLAEVFLELRQRDEDENWEDAQHSLNARRLLNARRAKAEKPRAKSSARLRAETLALEELALNPKASNSKVADVIKKRGVRTKKKTLCNWIRELKSHRPTL